MTHLRLITNAQETEMREAVVVVPTLNEQGNIEALIDGILAADARLHVVVVDDGSTDGTPETVDRISHDQTTGVAGRVHLIARGRKMGYASAVQDGMAFALDMGADLVLQMDADFSHDPAALPDLLALSETHDLVIGSRYVSGGGTRNWSLKRRLLSRGANSLARTLLRLPLHDCTGGFRCWHADLIERCGVLDSGVQGYSFLFMTLDRCRRTGARIGEVPIIFAERRLGQSKMNGAILREAIVVLFRLWVEHLGQPPVPVSVAVSSTAPANAETEGGVRTHLPAPLGVLPRREDGRAMNVILHAQYQAAPRHTDDNPTQDIASCAALSSRLGRTPSGAGGWVLFSIGYNFDYPWTGFWRSLRMCGKPRRATPGAKAWQGRDPLSGQAVLIKRLSAEPRHKTRATQALALAHPYIVPTRRWLRDGDDFYVVRDFIPGLNLRQTLADVRRRAFDGLLSLLTPVLDALDYAHRAGLPHGGVTPENVLVGADGRGLLCDFGTIENTDGAHLTYVPRSLIAADGRPTPQADFYALCELYKEFLPARSSDDEAGTAARQRLLRNLSETQQTATNTEELRYKLDAVAKMAGLLGFSGEQTEDGPLVGLRPARLVCTLTPPTATLAPNGGTIVSLFLANEGDRPLHVESVTSDVVWLNLPTRLAPFDLPPDGRRELLWTLSGARLLPGSYNAHLSVRSNSGMTGEHSLDGLPWDEQTVAIPTLVRGAVESGPGPAVAVPPGPVPLAEQLPPPSIEAVSSSGSPSIGGGGGYPGDEHPGIAVTQEPDPGLARSGQNGVLHLGVRNIGLQRLRVDSVTTFPSWLVYPGAFQALWIEPGATQYLGFSIVTASLPGGDYKAEVTFITSVLTETLIGLQPTRRQMKCDVRVRVVRGLGTPSPTPKTLGCAPLVIGLLSATGLCGLWLLILRAA